MNFGKGRRKPGVMNKLEALYAEELEKRKGSGEVLGYWFEAVKFKLANNTSYTPDFMVLMKSLEIEIHEVKGFWMDDARVKIKVASEKFPFKFIAIKRIKGEWAVEQF